MNENINTVGEGLAPPVKERTPEMIGAEIRMYVDAGRRITLLCGIEIGRRLVEAKEMLNHGEWLPWLERETKFSTSSAQRYMKVFEEYGAAQLGLFGPETNSPTLGNMSISNALRLLAIPEEERESFAQEHDVENMSARDLEALVKDRTDELRAQKEEAEAIARGERDSRWKAEKAREEADTAREVAENARAEAEEQLRRIKAELDEIEKRPQATVYERDEEAIAEEVEAALQIEREHAEKEKTRAIRDAVVAEREELEKERVKLQEKIAELTKRAEEKEKALHAAQDDMQKAQADAKDAREAAAKAQEAGADAEALRGQIDTLRKQLSLAAPEVAEFKAAFDRAQDELVHMNDALHRIQDAEIKEKLRKACTAMLDGFSERVKG